MISIARQFLRKKLSYPNLKGGKIVLNNSTTKRQIKHWSNKFERAFQRVVNTSNSSNHLQKEWHTKLKISITKSIWAHYSMNWGTLLQVWSTTSHVSSWVWKLQLWIEKEFTQNRGHIIEQHSNFFSSALVLKKGSF